MITRVTEHQPRQRACFLPYIACGRRNRVYPSYRIDRAHYETISNLKRHAFRALRGSGLACTACPAHAANDEFLRDTIPHRTCLQLLRLEICASHHYLIFTTAQKVLVQNYPSTRAGFRDIHIGKCWLEYKQLWCCKTDSMALYALCSISMPLNTILVF